MDFIRRNVPFLAGFFNCFLVRSGDDVVGIIFSIGSVDYAIDFSQVGWDTVSPPELSGNAPILDVS